jgi:flagellar hook-associated protein 1 FlgK
MNSRFQDVSSQVSQSMITTVDQINTYTKGIADINTKISKYINGVDGSQQPNDLLDQRDLLLNKLSSLVDVNVVEQGNGMQNVYIGKGQPLVIDGTTNTLNLGAQPSDPSKLDVFLQTPNATQNISAQIVGGSLSGAMRFRDEVLQPTQQSLKNIAETLSSQFNAVHKVGYDLNGATGNDFFSFNPVSGQLTNTITDPRKIAAANSAVTLPGDNRNALALANLENTPVALLQNGVPTGTTSTLQDAYGQMVSKVGALTNAANVSASAQQSLLNNAKTASESVSGVNLDEEAANLIKYQQSYQAAAQLIAITKGIFDSLLGAFR